MQLHFDKSRVFENWTRAPILSLDEAETIERDLESWLQSMMTAWEPYNIPEKHRVEIAFHYIGELALSNAILALYNDDADNLEGVSWVMFEILLRMYAAGILDGVEDRKGKLAKAGEFIVKNPATSLASAGLFVAGAVVMLPALAVGGLNLLGFSSAGPVAGSIAAGIQAGYGGVIASGSLFSLAQAAAMGGIAVAPLGGQLVAVGALGLGGFKIRQAMPGEEHGNEPRFDPEELKKVDHILRNWGDEAPRYNGPPDDFKGWLRRMKLSLKNLGISDQFHTLVAYNYLGPRIRRAFGKALEGAVVEEKEIVFTWVVMENGIRIYLDGYHFG